MTDERLPKGDFLLQKSALKVIRQNATKTLSKASLEDFYISIVFGVVHMIDQSDAVLSTKDELIMKRRDSVKLEESAESAKPESMDHYKFH